MAHVMPTGGGTVDRRPANRAAPDIRVVAPVYSLHVGIEQRQSVLGRALDAMGDAAFVLHRDGRLAYANRSGQALLDAADALYVRRGRVEAVDPAERIAFAAKVTAAGHGDTGAVSLPIRSGGRLNVTMAPADASGGVVMLAARVRRDDERIPALLVQAFGLTQAEADVARAIGAGAAPAEIAAARRASVSTVQSQLKTVAMKLGCRRQSEIAAIVQAMPRLR